MDFYGITHYGPQDYFQDIVKEEYSEPMSKVEIKSLMEKVNQNSTCPKTFQKPDVNVIRVIDCYLGRVNGFAYGSFQRFIRMKRKGIIKPVGPAEMYRFPPTTYTEIGWWQCDPELQNKTWYVTKPRFPQPSSPNTRILDKVRLNNKYASLF